MKAPPPCCRRIRFVQVEHKPAGGDRGVHCRAAILHHLKPGFRCQRIGGGDHLVLGDGLRRGGAASLRPAAATAIPFMTASCLAGRIVEAIEPTKPAEAGYSIHMENCRRTVWLCRAPALRWLVAADRWSMPRPCAKSGTPMSVIERITAWAWRRAVDLGDLHRCGVAASRRDGHHFKAGAGAALQRLVQRRIQDLLVINIGMIEADHHQQRAARAICAPGTRLPAAERSPSVATWSFAILDRACQSGEIGALAGDMGRSGAAHRRRQRFQQPVDQHDGLIGFVFLKKMLLRWSDCPGKEMMKVTQRSGPAHGERWRNRWSTSVPSALRPLMFAPTARRAGLCATFHWLTSSGLPRVVPT